MKANELVEHGKRDAADLKIGHYFKMNSGTGLWRVIHVHDHQDGRTTIQAEFSESDTRRTWTQGQESWLGEVLVFTEGEYAWNEDEPDERTWDDEPWYDGQRDICEGTYEIWAQDWLAKWSTLDPRTKDGGAQQVQAEMLRDLPSYDGHMGPVVKLIKSDDRWRPMRERWYYLTGIDLDAWTRFGQAPADGMTTKTRRYKMEREEATRKKYGGIWTIYAPGLDVHDNEYESLYDAKLALVLEAIVEMPKAEIEWVEARDLESADGRPTFFCWTTTTQATSLFWSHTSEDEETTIGQINLVPPEN